MSLCEQLSAQASAGAAPALRAVDCLANETTAVAFGRLFGGNGALAPVLTLLLTLYIAFFAISLLTGRSRIGISALTPRMMTLGLVLTFATSWIAYQSVVWNLAIGAPDQIAAVLTGARGSATTIFADKIDIVFAAIAEAAAGQGGQPAAGAQGAAQGSFTPGNLMWLGALMLLLGTVGVLVTARIALAVLLALGPIFVVLALFSGTRGLFVGWLRGVAMTALTPLFVVVGGGVTLELLVPVIASLRSAEGIDGRAAIALFLIAAVHVALMAMVLKVSGTMVSAWQVFGLAAKDERGDAPLASDTPTAAAAGAGAAGTAAVTAPFGAGRRPALVTGAAPVTVDGAFATGAPSAATSRAVVVPAAANPSTAGLPQLPAHRARGIGSRFRAPTSARIREYAR